MIDIVADTGEEKRPRYAAIHALGNKDGDNVIATLADLAARDDHVI